MPHEPMTPKGRMVWPTAFPKETEAQMHRRPEPQPTKLRDVEAGVHPYHSPTGRRFSQPEMQELPTTKQDLEELRAYSLADVKGATGGLVKGGGGLVGADYSQVERRVMVMGGRGSSKTLALMAQMKATERDIAMAFAVPADIMGEETNSPLTGDELRSIMEQQPEFREPKPRGKSKNPFAEGSIKQYMK